MIVEDNPKVRRISVERIRALGFKLIEAENGDEATPCSGQAAMSICCFPIW